MSAESRTRRRRRTPEEQIADLEQEIALLEQRARAKALVRSGAVKAALAAVRSIDKGIAAARAESNDELRAALARAREPLATHLESLGARFGVKRRQRAGTG